MGDSHGMQCLYLRRGLVSCFHLGTRRKPWELASSFLAENKSSVDHKRSPQDCKGVEKVELTCCGREAAAES